MEDINLGYEAINKKRKWVSTTEDEYLISLEQSDETELTISGHEVLDEVIESKKLTETYAFEMDLEKSSARFYVNPFIVKQFRKNPFTLDSRNYPIDFGYNRNYTYYFRLLVPDNITVKELPNARTISLPNNAGNLRFDCAASDGIVNLYFNLNLRSAHYSSDVYQMIKTLFDNVVEVQNKSLIVLESASD